MIVANDGYVAVSLIHCAGDVFVGATQNYNDIFDIDAIQDTETYPAGHTVTKVFHVTPGVLYYIIASPNITQSIGNMPDNTAFYTLQSKWYKD